MLHTCVIVAKCSYDPDSYRIVLLNLWQVLLAKDIDIAKIVLEQYEALVLEHLPDASLDHGICRLNRGIIDMMKGKPEFLNKQNNNEFYHINYYHH